MLTFISILVTILFVLGVINMIFVSPIFMNVGLLTISSTDYKVTKKELLYCCIPLFNHFYGWKKYAGSYLSISGICSLIFYSTILVRLAVMLFFFDNLNIQTITIYAFLISVVIFWVGSAIDVFKILNDSGVYTMGSMVFNSISILTGQILIGHSMPKKMYYYYISSDKKGSLYV